MLKSRTVLSAAALTAFALVPGARAGAQEAAAADTAARFYASRCTGCHTIGRGALTGPDLSASLSWREADLELAILRMQEKAGSFTRDDVAGLMQLLKDPSVNDRIAAEQARIAQQFAVKLAPADAELGKRLYQGRTTFENGGMACIACHALGELDGGTLGPNLSGVFSRMGEAGMFSALEKSPFKVMAPLYQNKPLTQQEILHLSRWLQSVDAQPPVEQDGIVAPAAASIAVMFLGLLVLGTRRAQPTSARRMLERKARQ